MLWTRQQPKSDLVLGERGELGDRRKKKEEEGRMSSSLALEEYFTTPESKKILALSVLIKEKVHEQIRSDIEVRSNPTGFLFTAESSLKPAWMPSYYCWADFF